MQYLPVDALCEIARWLRSAEVAFLRETCIRCSCIPVPREPLNIIRYGAEIDSVEMCEAGSLAGHSTSGVAEVAAAAGSIRALVWLREAAPSYYTASADALLDIAVEHGHLHLVEWFSRVGGPETFACAARGKNLEVLRYLETHQCPRVPKAFTEAIDGKDERVIEWFASHHMPADFRTFEAAVTHGHVWLVVILAARGCRMRPWAHVLGARRGDVRMLEVLSRLRIPPHAFACEAAAAHGHPETLEWLMSKRFPHFFTRDNLAGYSAESQEIILRYV